MLRMQVMSTTNKLVIDIETIGEDFDSLDKATKENLTRWIKGIPIARTNIRSRSKTSKTASVFRRSPARSSRSASWIITKTKARVYYQAPGQKNAEVKEDGITFKQMTEEEMLRKFWELAERYQVFITFNGRAFDMPFIIIRSAINGIRPTKDLMRGRYFIRTIPKRCISILPNS